MTRPESDTQRSKAGANAGPTPETTPVNTGPARTQGRRASPVRLGNVVMAIYLVFLLLPIYWLVIMSFKSNAEILGAFTLFPDDFTLANYRTILTDPSWYMGYVNSFL